MKKEEVWWNGQLTSPTNRSNWTPYTEVASEGLEKFVVLKLFKLLGLRFRGLFPQALTMPMYKEGSFSWSSSKSESHPLRLTRLLFRHDPADIREDERADRALREAKAAKSGNSSSQSAQAMQAAQQARFDIVEALIVSSTQSESKCLQIRLQNMTVKCKKAFDKHKHHNILSKLYSPAFQKTCFSDPQTTS